MGKLSRLIVLAFLLVVGCQQTSPSSSPSTNVAPSTQASTPKPTIESLEKRIADLEFRLWILENDSALLDCTSKGYSRTRTHFGTVIVVCENAVQYLDGYRLNLKIGNLTSARFNGANLKFYYHGKSKELSVTNVFPPGRYTSLDVILSPAQADDIKKILMDIEFDNLSLL